MDEAKILLISSERLGWQGVRAIRAARQDQRVIEDVQCAAEGLAVAVAMQPNLVVTTDEPPDAGIVPLVEELHARCPATKILVFGDAPTPGTHLKLGESGVRGYLPWATLNGGALPHILATVLGSDVVVASPGAIGHLRDGHDHSPDLPPAIRVSERELTVLRGLAAGLKQGEIAEAEHLSLRSVSRVVEALHATLDAPTIFQLGMKAQQFGLV